MRMTRSARVGRVLTATILTTATAVAGLLFPPVTAQAADPLGATVTFSSVITDDSGLTLTGTVANTGPAIFKAQVSLWRDRATISTHDQLDQALNADPNADTGDRVATSDAVTVIASGASTFDEAGTAAFSVHASWAELGTSNDGVYLVGVHVRGAPTRLGSVTTIARGRTLITLPGEKTVQSAQVVMLTSAPSLLHDSLFVDDHLVDDLRGRLGTLLQQASLPGSSWAIDPLLYNEVTLMAAGYKVLVADKEIAGSGQQVARSWLNDFARLTRGTGYRLPYGNPDFSVGLATNDPWMIDQAVAATPPTQLATLPLLVRAKNGMGNLAWLNYIAPLGPDIVLMEAPESGTLSTPSSSTVTSVLPALVTPYLPGPDSDNSDLQVSQRAQAEDYLAGSCVVRVITNEEDAATASRITNGFAIPDSLRHLPVQGPIDTATEFGEAAGTLTPDALSRVEPARTAMETYAALIKEDEIASTLASPALAVTLSQGWDSDADSARYAHAIESWLMSLVAKVNISSAASEVTLTSRTNAFPITISNDLDHIVYVQVSASTSSSLILNVPTSQTIEVSPGDRIPATLTPTIYRDGEATIVVHLQTETGTPIGDPATIHIIASQSAWLGWAIVIGAGTIFVAGTVLRVRTASKKRSTIDTSEGNTSHESDNTLDNTSANTTHGSDNTTNTADSIAPSDAPPNRPPA